MNWFSHVSHDQRYCSWACTHDDDDAGVAQHGGHTPNNRLTETYSLGYPVLLWYWTSTLWSIGTCQNKIFADQYNVTISRAQVLISSRSRVFWSWPLTKFWFSIGSRADAMLTCWKQARIVRKPASASPRLNFIRIVTFSSIQMLFDALFCVYKTQKISPQSYKTQIKIHLFLR